MNGAIIFSLERKDAANGFRPACECAETSALKRLILTLTLARVSPVIVLTGRRLDVEVHLAHRGVICLGPEDPSGVLDIGHLEHACRLLGEDVRRILLLPASCALVGTDTINALLASAATPVRPMYRHQVGFPLAVSKADLEDALCNMRRFDIQSREILSVPVDAFSKRFDFLTVSDEGSVTDLSRLDDWRDRLKVPASGYFRAVSKFMVARDEVFLGPGTAQLLQAISTSGSVRGGCTLIGLSYTKGWQMLQTFEEQCGHAAVIRKKGGAGGGSARLSSAGEDFLSRYRAYAADCTAYAERRFKDYFSDYDKTETKGTLR